MKFSKAKKYMATSVAFFAAGMMLSTPAAAQGFAGLFNNTLITQFAAGADFMSAIAYLAGVGFGIKGAMKLKDWSDSKGRDATLGQAMIPLVIAGMLLGLPSVLKIARESSTGAGVQGTGINGNSAIRSIN